MSTTNDRSFREHARHILEHAPGWIDWNPARKMPNWIDGRVTLDGRFSLEELLAIVALATPPH